MKRRSNNSARKMWLAQIWISPRKSIRGWSRSLARQAAPAGMTGVRATASLGVGRFRVGRWTGPNKISKPARRSRLAL